MKIQKFLSNLRYIFKPSFWYMLERYSAPHDAAINDLMDKHKFTLVSEHRAYLGDFCIWIANYPYAVGIKQLSFFSRPSRRTIERMRRKLKEDTGFDITNLEGIEQIKIEQEFFRTFG